MLIGRLMPPLAAIAMLLVGAPQSHAQGANLDNASCLGCHGDTGLSVAAGNGGTRSLSLSSDHVAAFTLWAREAGWTAIVCDFLFHPDEMERPGFDPSDAVEFWDLVNRQDWKICEQVQDGMSSRKFTFGYLAPMEQPSADVGRYILARLR